MELTDMARAHLENVQGALRDLFAQREKVDQEIARLSAYLKEGESLVLGQEAPVIEDQVGE